jgi:hypothetical protein
MDEVNKAIDEAVQKAVDRKVGEYRKVVLAFVAGLGLLTGGLVLDTFFRQGAFINAFREQLIGFEPLLAKELGPRVAFSYASSFWIQPPDFDAESLAFFVREGQQVKARVEILHQGAGDPLPIQISIDNQDPIPQGSGDKPWQEIDLTEKVNRQSEFRTVTGDVHYFTVSTPPHPKNQKDRVHVRALVIVYGLEKRPW